MPADVSTRALLPPRATADGTHRRLLEEALLLFGARGFHGVSVREITEATGIRASSLYAHMDSKEQLLVELVTIGHAEHHDLLQTALREASSDPVDRLARLVRAHVFLHATYPLLARICNRELQALSDSSRARVMQVRNASQQLVADVVEEGMTAGVFHVDDVWLASAATLAMGLRIAEWWSDELGYTVEQVADAYATFAVRLVTSERTAPLP
jgi:AcrR family transcriptional regulator